MRSVLYRKLKLNLYGGAAFLNDFGKREGDVGVLIEGFGQFVKEDAVLLAYELVFLTAFVAGNGVHVVPCELDADFGDIVLSHAQRQMEGKCHIELLAGRIELEVFRASEQVELSGVAYDGEERRYSVDGVSFF